MVLKSKFTFLVYIPLLILLVTTGIFSVMYFIMGIRELPEPFFYFFIVALCWNFIILLLYEMHLKMPRIQLNKREITIREFYGLLNEKKYRLKDLDGFHTYTRSIRQSRGFKSEIKEYLFFHIMHNNRIIARISSQYHSNYNEMANFLKEHLTDLGYKKPGIASEIKASLRF